ncbi:MAG: hypothetical protein QOI99_577 [Actinomycetota bacterium]|nr:hypothetical protein [Actinomycetota bacterium]
MAKDKPVSGPMQIEVAKTTEIHLELDDRKLEAIKACLTKGRLSIKVSHADLSVAGRLQAAYEYD